MFAYYVQYCTYFIIAVYIIIILQFIIDNNINKIACQDYPYRDELLVH